MLIRCPECEKEISSYAEKCTNCGIPSQYIIIKKVPKCEELCKKIYDNSCEKCKSNGYNYYILTEVIDRKLC